MSDEKQADRPETWGIVEVMGHSRYAGRLSEDQRFGFPLLRVEVPAIEGAAAFEKHLGGASIFAITPCSEEVARAAAVRFAARPITLVDFAPRLPAPQYDEDDEDDEDCGDDPLDM
jgi:hypothetical protein